MNKVSVIGIVGNSVFLPVEKFHIGGETVEANDARFELGGKGFNQAVAAARMGAEVSFLAAVGEDSIDKIEAFLKAEGIKSVLVKKDTPTAFAAIVTDRSGANRVTVYQGAQLEASDVETFRSEIEESDILLINNEVDESVNIAASEIAEQSGVKIILNPAPARETQKELLDRVYLFTPNEHESEGLEEYSNVIQTLGKHGCLIKSENTTVPPTNDKAVDTTGAGDTFNGALAASIAEGKSLYDSVAVAVRASGRSVTKRGAVTSIPYRNEVV